MGATEMNAFITPLKRIEGRQGGVWHALKVSSPGYAGFGEAYFSQIHEGAIKSWRRHRLATLNLIVPSGAVRFVVGDDGSFGEHLIGPDSYVRLTVLPGLWLAFRGVGPGTSTILCISDLEHDPSESDTRDIDAFSYHW